MKLRLLLLVLASLCCVHAAPLHAANVAPEWRGAGVMKGGKGYATTRWGQVDYRDIGPRNGKVPLLLIHQAWMSMVEFAQIQDELAKLGYRSIAFDTPGYGMSDPAPAQPTIRDFADNIVSLLDALKIRKVVAVGHHTGALMAASLAVHHRDRVVALVLHGVPYFSKAQSQAALAQPDYDRTPLPDGSHLSRLFTFDIPGDPHPNTAANMRSRTWMVLNLFMMGPDVGHWAVYHYDLTPDAKAIRVPTLILTDAHDQIHNLDLRLARLRPDFGYEVFSDYSGIWMMNEPARWARMVGKFVAPLER